MFRAAHDADLLAEGVRYIAAHVRHLVLPAVDAQFQVHVAIALPRVAGIGKGTVVEVFARHHFADEEAQEPHHQTDDAKAQHEPKKAGICDSKRENIQDLLVGGRRKKPF